VGKERKSQERIYHGGTETRRGEVEGKGNREGKGGGEGNREWEREREGERAERGAGDFRGPAILFPSERAGDKLDPDLPSRSPCLRVSVVNSPSSSW